MCASIGFFRAATLECRAQRFADARRRIGKFDVAGAKIDQLDVCAKRAEAFREHAGDALEPFQLAAAPIRC